MIVLTELHTDIDRRVDAIRENQPDWLCGKGCDTCCRRLADIPQLTAEEWGLVREGLAALPPERLLDVSRDMLALAGQQSPPVVCPLLDSSNGACSIYAQRPVACRTYGFFVQRELGLYCHDIEALVAAGALPDVIWGNHDAIDQRLATMGGKRALTDWFSEWERAELVEPRT